MKRDALCCHVARVLYLQHVFGTCRPVTRACLNMGPMFLHFCPWNQNLVRVRTRGGGCHVSFDFLQDEVAQCRQEGVNPPFCVTALVHGGCSPVLHTPWPPAQDACTESWAELVPSLNGFAMSSAFFCSLTLGSEDVLSAVGTIPLQVLPRGWGYLFERGGAVQVLNWDSPRGGGCVQDREPPPPPNTPQLPSAPPNYARAERSFHEVYVLHCLLGAFKGSFVCLPERPIFVFSHAECGAGYPSCVCVCVVMCM